MTEGVEPCSCGCHSPHGMTGHPGGELCCDRPFLRHELTEATDA